MSTEVWRSHRYVNRHTRAQKGTSRSAVTFPREQRHAYDEISTKPNNVITNNRMYALQHTPALAHGAPWYTCSGRDSVQRAADLVGKRERRKHERRRVRPEVAEEKRQAASTIREVSYRRGERRWVVTRAGHDFKRGSAIDEAAQRHVGAALGRDRKAELKPWERVRCSPRAWRQAEPFARCVTTQRTRFVSYDARQESHHHHVCQFDLFCGLWIRHPYAAAEKSLNTMRRSNLNT